MSGICNILTTQVKHRYKVIHMGDSISQEIFQDKISKMFQGFNFICTYIDGLIVQTTGCCTDKLDKLQQ